MRPKHAGRKSSVRSTAWCCVLQASHHGSHHGIQATILTPVHCTSRPHHQLQLLLNLYLEAICRVLRASWRPCHESSQRASSTINRSSERSRFNSRPPRAARIWRRACYYGWRGVSRQRHCLGCIARRGCFDSSSSTRESTLIDPFVASCSASLHVSGSDSMFPSQIVFWGSVTWALVLHCIELAGSLLVEHDRWLKLLWTQDLESWWWYASMHSISISSNIWVHFFFHRLVRHEYMIDQLVHACTDDL